MASQRVACLPSAEKTLKCLFKNADSLALPYILMSWARTGNLYFKQDSSHSSVTLCMPSLRITDTLLIYEDI